MSTPNDGGSCQPIYWRNDTGQIVAENKGLTILDAFAIAAMQGDWASQNDLTGIFTDTIPDERLEARATLYYRAAAAMLRAREKAMKEAKETP